MSDSLSGKLNSSQTHWYVVSTKPNHENQAEQNIARLGIECFLPLLQEQKIVRRKARTIVTPLFSGYLFVRINLLEHYRKLIYTRGVKRMVEFGSGPVAVDASTIDAIRSTMADSKVYVLEKPNDRKLSHGELVKIKEGPLAGLEAIFMHEMSGRQRAVVLLHALALQARAVVDLDQVTPFVAA